MIRHDINLKDEIFRMQENVDICKKVKGKSNVNL